MWEDGQYYWVVLCKNRWFHLRGSIFHGHRIVLDETDAVAAPPILKGSFRVHRDVCGKDYLYKPSELLRYEEQPPESFQPHRLFGEEQE